MGKISGKGKKKRYHHAFAQGAATAKLDYKSAVVGLKNDTFDVGVWSDPAKFSKLLRNIKNYIQKTYKEPDNIVKIVQEIKNIYGENLTENIGKIHECNFGYSMKGILF